MLHFTSWGATGELNTPTQLHLIAAAGHPIKLSPGNPSIQKELSKVASPLIGGAAID